MKLLKSDEMKLRIIKQLRAGHEFTINGLRMKVGAVNYTSVLRACHFLKDLGLLSMEAKPAGRRRYVYVALTELGEHISRDL